MPSLTSRAGATGIVLLWVAVILVVCFRPTQDDTAGTLSLCLICGGQGLSNLILNFGLYVPLGIALRWRGDSWTRAALTAFGLSFAVELVQLWVPGRHAALADLLTNSAGGALGAALGQLPRSWLFPPAWAARIAMLVSALPAIAVVTTTGVLFTPTLPPGQETYAQWSPRLGLPEPYGGRVLLTEIDGVPFRWGLLDPRAKELLGSDATLHLRFIVGPPPIHVSPVWRIIDGAGNDAFQVGVFGNDLLISHRYLADDMSLPRPVLRLTDELAGLRPGTTMDLTVEPLAGGGYRVTTVASSAEGGREERRAEHRLGPTVARGWSLLRFPAGYPDWVFSLADLIWLAALAAPLGWWAPSRFWAAVGVLVLWATLFSVPLWTRAIGTPFTAYAAVVVGVASTGALQHWARGRLGRGSETAKTI